MSLTLDTLGKILDISIFVLFFIGLEWFVYITCVLIFVADHLIDSGCFG